MTIQQPDGSTITLILQGDEWCHWYTNLDGELLLPDAEGCYRVASPAQEQAWQKQCQVRLAQRDAQEKQRLEQRQTRRAKMAQYAQEDSLPGLLPHIADNPVLGIEHGIVLLIEFPDMKFSMDDPWQHYNDMMMKPGFDYAFSETSKYRHNGSIHDYFYDCSDGKYDLQLEVFGPLMMPDSVRHYAAHSDRLAWEMIVKGCQQLDDSIDFSRFDNDGDGIIDFVASIYAGPGSNASGVSENQAIWPHQWTIGAAGGGQNYVDSLLISTYVCVNETYGGRPDGMGTFCHEFSHILGLPDLYYGSNMTPSGYDLMDDGAYNLNGFRPAAYTAYERYELGWLQPTPLTEADIYTLPALTMESKAYIVPVTQGIDDPREGEYYLFENRQPYAWDEYLPGFGMLVWHIDYEASRWAVNSPNGWSTHQCVDLVEANGKKNDSSVPFPGSAGRTSFTDDTKPAFRGWTNPGHNTSAMDVRLEKPIYNIRLSELAPELVPSDAIEGETFYDVKFDFLVDISAIKEICVENNVSGTARIEVREGRTIINTGQRSYDLFGRSL